MSVHFQTRHYRASRFAENVYIASMRAGGSVLFNDLVLDRFAVPMDRIEATIIVQSMAEELEHLNYERTRELVEQAREMFPIPPTAEQARQRRLRRERSLAG